MNFKTVFNIKTSEFLWKTYPLKKPSTNPFNMLQYVLNKKTNVFKRRTKN